MKNGRCSPALAQEEPKSSEKTPRRGGLAFLHVLIIFRYFLLFCCYFVGWALRAVFGYYRPWPDSRVLQKIIFVLHPA